jgi:carbon monoxide dehydrogenase subunit G
MELQGERLIPASVEATWAALNDPETLKACIAGCESLERTGDDAFAAVVALKIGPVSARFKGNLQMTNIQAPNGYTINFDGQGGVAGFGKGSADVALLPDGANTLLKYNARATVGGKMAQVGARLIDAAAGKITEDFFKAFEAQLQAAAAPAPAPADAGAAAPVPAEQPESGGGIKTVWWLIAAVIVLAAIYVLTKK